jgi:hypothetical protein
MTVVHSWWKVGRNAVCGLAVTAVLTPAAAGDAERWRLLFVNAPPPPTSLESARSRIVARRVGDAVVVEDSDPAWQRRAQEAQALITPVAAASAEQFKAAIERFNKDPEAARLANGLEKAIDDAVRSMQRGERSAIRSDDPDVDKLLRDPDKPPDPARLSPISAFLLEHQRAQPNGNTFRRQFHEQRRRFARMHAELDAAPVGDAGGVAARVQRHRDLAQQQLREAVSQYAAARDALSPAVERMVELATQAEQRVATAGERSPAYHWLKAVTEALDSMVRTTIEDVGFWAAVQPAAGSAPLPTYVLSLAPEIDLHADGVLPPLIVPYPRGRLSAARPPPASSAPR